MRILFSEIARKVQNEIKQHVLAKIESFSVEKSKKMATLYDFFRVIPRDVFRQGEQWVVRNETEDIHLDDDEVWLVTDSYDGESEEVHVDQQPELTDSQDCWLPRPPDEEDGWLVIDESQEVKEEEEEVIIVAMTVEALQRQPEQQSGQQPPEQQQQPEPEILEIATSRGTLTDHRDVICDCPFCPWN